MVLLFELVTPSGRRRTEKKSMRKELDSPFSSQSAAGLNVPRVRCDGVEREALGDLRRRHGALHILFVSQNQDGCLLQVLYSNESAAYCMCKKRPLH